MNLKGNKRNKQYTLELADGKIKSFADGAAMHAWYMKNKDSHKHRKKKRPSRDSQNK